MPVESPPPLVSTTRLTDPERGPAIVAILAVAFIAAATGISVLTGASGGPSTGVGVSAAQPDTRVSLAVEAPDATRAASTLSPPTAEPSLRPGEIACMPAGWRLAFVGSVLSLPVETWLVVEPAEASDPLDARIPVTWLGRQVISGLGACAPPDGAEGGARPAIIERAWRVGHAGGSDVVVPIELVASAHPALVTPGPRPDAVPLVRPAGGAVSWAPGEYVLKLGLPGIAGRPPSPGASGWLRIQLDAQTP